MVLFVTLLKYFLYTLLSLQVSRAVDEEVETFLSKFLPPMERAEARESNLSFTEYAKRTGRNVSLLYNLQISPKASAPKEPSLPFQEDGPEESESSALLKQNMYSLKKEIEALRTEKEEQFLKIQDFTAKIASCEQIRASQLEQLQKLHQYIQELEEEVAYLKGASAGTKPGSPSSPSLGDKLHQELQRTQKLSTALELQQKENHALRKELDELKADLIQQENNLQTARAHNTSLLALKKSLEARIREDTLWQEDAEATLSEYDGIRERLTAEFHAKLELLENTNIDISAENDLLKERIAKLEKLLSLPDE